eukprot:10526463-Alexandrium_andersonii.AAC.1
MSASLVGSEMCIRDRCVLAIRFPRRQQLQTFTPADAADYIDYLLGEDISDNCARDMAGAVLASPSFTI